MASLEQQLKAIKLKKSAKPTSDFSNPKLGGFISEQEISDYQNSVLDVNTELWVDILKEETFPTKYCEITKEDANLFIEIYERLYKDIDESKIAGIDWRDGLNEQEVKQVEILRNRLQSKIDEFVKEGSDVFVKTSSRSAKDAPLVQKRFVDIFKKTINTCRDNSENSQISALLTAAFEAQRIHSAEEVFDMFLRSLRIYQDLTLARDNPERFNENFVIRKFIDIDIDMEFRGFVFEHDLVALSQYNYLIFSGRLLKEGKQISERIQRFFDKSIKEKMKQKNFPHDYVIDFAVCNNSTEEKIWVIEINPFLETTDGALFSWNKERHLLEGKEGFQLRLTKANKPGSIVMLPQSAKELLKKCMSG
ncbi:unnamed protein product [Owenia fusiformis]|uniref:Uncharacterized protein n=1 Tax=Owenia fusiformis TaxID=6347 RepID=A0A8J1U8L3_OWEFU|nr:unnamed protein product [Owenia fusiformis]